MYNVSGLFKSYTKEFSRTIEAKVDINGSTFLGSDVVEFSVEERIVPGEDFSLGTAISSILNLSLRITETVAAGAKIIPYIRLLGMSGESEWLKLGEYYVDSRVMNNKVWSFICYDKLIYGQQDYLSGLSYPTSMQNVWNDLCSRLGVQSDASVDINPTYIFDVAPTGHTLREVMGFIAGAHAASVRMTKDGLAGFVKFIATATAVETITASDYVAAPQTNPSKSYTRIVVQRNDDGDSSQIEVGTGAEDKTLTLVNPYITQTMLNNMYAVFNGFRYIPFNMDWRCFPYLEVGDRIDVEMLNSLSWVEAAMPWQEADFPWRDLPKFSSVIFTNKLFFKGGLKAISTATSTSAQHSETAYKGSLTEQVKEIDKKALKEYKPYYGVTFGRDYGFKVMSDSGSEAIFNSDVIAMRAGGEDKLYFDTVSGKYKFNGTLEAVDGIFSGTVFAENINTTNAKIATAQIENLEVGANVAMGANATISWGKVTSQPFIPQTAADIGALTSGQLYTTLGQDYVVTGRINAYQINGAVANLSENVNIGNVLSATAKGLYFYNAGGSDLSALVLDTYGDLSLKNRYKTSVAGNRLELLALDTVDITGTNVEIYGATSFYGSLGFFGKSPITQKTASNLPTSATLSDVITKINGILGILGQSNYNLIYVS